MSSSRSKLTDRIAELGNLTREDLVALWVKMFKHPPPKAVKRGLLERAIAHHLQGRRLGGLKPETRRSLLSIAADAESKVGVAPSTSLKPGSRLVREWHGKPYQVNVTDTGFEWDGNECASLSTIAKVITGAKWSGPRLFGL